MERRGCLSWNLGWSLWCKRATTNAGNTPQGRDFIAQDRIRGSTCSLKGEGIDLYSVDGLVGRTVGRKYYVRILTEWYHNKPGGLFKKADWPPVSTTPYIHWDW